MEDGLTLEEWKRQMSDSSHVSHTDDRFHSYVASIEEPNRVAPIMPLTSPEFAPAILNALADAVVIYDAAGGVVGSNHMADTMFGLSLPGRSEALAAPISKREGATDLWTLDGRLLQREEWPAMRVTQGETLAGAKTVDVVARLVDGQKYVFNVSGAPLRDAAGQVVGAVCVLRDITERTRLERDVAARVAELEGIFATQTEGVILVGRDGRVLRMNEAQRRLLLEGGVDPENDRIETWADAAAPLDEQQRPLRQEQLPYYRALRGETIAGEDAVELYQHERNGRNLVVRVSAAPLRDERGQILGVVVTNTDVTRQRLLEQQRLAVMRMVVHDLGNPLAAIQLYVQTQQRRLAHGLAPFTPDDTLLEHMNYGLTRVQRLLEDLSVATQVELGTLKLRRARCDLTMLCREEVATQQAVSGRDIMFEAPDEPVWVKVDTSRIGQVIGNLLTNALKHSPADQPVVISVLDAPKSEALEKGEPGVGEPGKACVNVRDAGTGIPEQERQRIFEEFHRGPGVEAQDGDDGVGLGLYISKGIVEAHAGRIGVESRVGEGSTFWFTLPLADEAAHGSTEGSEPSA